MRSEAGLKTCPDQRFSALLLPEVTTPGPVTTQLHTRPQAAQVFLCTCEAPTQAPLCSGDLKKARRSWGRSAIQQNTAYLRHLMTDIPVYTPNLLGHKNLTKGLNKKNTVTLMQYQDLESSLMSLISVLISTPPFFLLFFLFSPCVLLYSQ